MAIDCTSEALVAAANENCCIPKGLENAAIIYLLNQLLTTPKTVHEILDGAACYKCIPQGMQLESQTYLLCLALQEIDSILGQ